MSKKQTFPFHRPSQHNSDSGNYRILLLFLLILTSLPPLYFIWNSYFENGFFGFPFDDVFIHLTFARNLSEYHAFSYFKNEMITSGSSSPLYTFLLACGYSFMKDEFLLCYFAGILFFLISVCIYFKLNKIDFGSDHKYLIAAVLIFALDKNLIFFSVSGMETVLFVMNLLALIYFYRKKNIILLSVSMALIIWIRPEGILFIAALMFYHLLQMLFSKDAISKGSEKFTFKETGAVLFAVSASFLMYASFNFILSGTIFPNTFYAKKIFYSPEFMSRIVFLQNDVWGYFTSGSYSFLMIGCAVSVIKIFYDLIKRRSNIYLLYFTFILIFISAYIYKMPYSGMNGRYFVPLIPFYLMLSFSGFVLIFETAGKIIKSDQLNGILKYAALLAFMYSMSFDLSSEINSFSDDCRGNHVTHIEAANWIREHTSPDDIIATHEIGAMGFYSERRITDIAGLITPDLINKLADDDYVLIMQQYLKEKGVKYFATMRNWCRIVNSNPLFTSGNSGGGSGIFEIFLYDPDNTHILSKKVNKSVSLAQYNLKKNRPVQALKYLNEALLSDSASSLIYYMKAEAFIRSGDTMNAEMNLLKAIKLFPENAPANLKLYDLYKFKGDFTLSRQYLLRYNRILNIIKNHDKNLSGL